MKPTSQLRFVERTHQTSIDNNGIAIGMKIRVLQQLWEPTDEPYEEWLKIKDGEWRDIPLEKEQ